MLSTGVVFVALLAVVAAKPAARDFHIHERRDSAPAGFIHAGAAASNTKLNLRVALAQTDFPGLEKALYDVSTPSSPQYGEHLTKEEVAKFTAPKPEALKAVNDWLAAHNITAKTLSPAGDWLGFSVTVKEANELFDADFSVFKHTDSDKDTIRTLSYSIPASLKGHVDVVHPTVSFPNPRPIRPKFVIPPSIDALANNHTSLASSCASLITPSCLQSLYGIPATPATQSSNKLAVSGYIEQYAQSADLKSFLTKFRTDISSSTTFTLQTLDGGSNPQGSRYAGIEANLDIEYTVGVATGVPVQFISVGESFQDGDLEGFLDIVNFIAAETTPPYVLTTSYGQDESTISRALATKLCNAYASIGARGVSILFASGDGGVSGSQSQSCSKFIPTFPSGCPYLTSVGATQSVGPETAASLSSGGFSNYFGIPSYQASAVAAYKSAIGSTYSGKYNTTGRGFPDVAAQGESVEIVSGGSTGAVAGTSCSSPIFASVIALLNDQLIAAGKSPLGFLNPWLYSTAASALNDITSGSNPGCSTNGFSARAGWDPVTGLGTPNFAKLKAAAGL